MIVRYRPLPRCERPPKLLCRSYLLACIGSMPLVGLPTCVAHWACGALADGQFEVFGGWVGAAADPTTLFRAVESLRERGLERVRLLMTSGCEALPLAKLLGVEAPALEDRAGLQPSLRRALQSGQGEFSRLQGRLERAVSRRRFEDQDDAFSFLTRTLDREERLLGRQAGVRGASLLRRT